MFSKTSQVSSGAAPALKGDTSRSHSMLAQASAHSHQARSVRTSAGFGYRAKECLRYLFGSCLRARRVVPIDSIERGVSSRG